MFNDRPVILWAAILSAALPWNSTTALADQAAADKCSRTLAPQAAAIYRATLPDIGKDTVIADAIKKRVQPMVMSGQMDRASARPFAEAAGGCLKLLRE